jgi:hypothetical protein
VLISRSTTVTRSTCGEADNIRDEAHGEGEAATATRCYRVPRSRPKTSPAGSVLAMSSGL